MEASEKTCVDAKQAVGLIMDEAVVDGVVNVLSELYIEEGYEVAFDLSDLAELISSELSNDIEIEEEERLIEESQKDEDVVVCADIEALVSSIESRSKYQADIDEENRKQKAEEVGSDVLAIHDVQFVLPIPEKPVRLPIDVDLVPNQDCRSKTSTKRKTGGKKTAAPPPPPAANEELLSDEQLQQFVDEQRSANTVKRTKQVVSKFEAYLATHHLDGRQMHTLDAHTLNNYITNYLLVARRDDGTPYEPDTLTSIHRGLDRHLKERKYPYSILLDDEFNPSRVVLQSRRKQLKSLGKGNRPNRSDAVSDDQLEKVWEREVFGSSTPRTLQNTLFFYLASGFGFRGCHESRQLQWGDVVPGIDDKGLHYLELRCERITKTRQGGQGGHVRAYNPRVYQSEDSARCPVQLYQLFKQKRPATMKVPESPFYLTPKQNVLPREPMWYKAAPMGINMLSKIMPDVARTAELDGRITNHSIRRTACQNLLASDIPSIAAIQLTGHKSVESLSHYQTATKRQQREMAQIATGQKKARESEGAMSLYTPPPVPSVPSATPGSPVCDAVVPEPDGPSHPMASLASSANGLLSGASIAGNVTIQFNYCPQSSSVSTNNDLEVINNTQQ